jgi:ketol-acid reductoisomerase
MKLIVDLMYEGGLSKMWWSVSDTAEYGGYISGPRIVTEATRAEMRRILTEVRDGSFAQRWIDEYESGSPNFTAMREAERQRQIEQTGAALRPMMSWID